MNVQGFNHVTINVKSLHESLPFYVDALGMDLVHKGSKDAYLEWGSAWICLQERGDYSDQRIETLGVDHVAFTINEENFHNAAQQLKEKDIPIVRGPVQRGGGWTINFLDPDGTNIELHTGSLKERMKHWGGME